MRDWLRELAEQAGERVMAVAEDRLGVTIAREAREQQQASAVAIISLQGPLTPRGVRFFGYTVAPGMDAFRNRLNQAVADPNVAAIVLDVDSPGGTVAGTVETANAVRAAAEAKPVIAVADTMAASAAYWIASQASELVVTPSGEVGSIGVLAVHLDWSESFKMEGIKPTIIRSRPGKADATFYEPLTAEAEEAIRASVMEADEEFVRAVAKGRGVTPAVVRSDFGEGRMLSSKVALKAGMVDRIATMPEVLSGLVKTKAQARRRASFDF